LKVLRFFLNNLAKREKLEGLNPAEISTFAWYRRDSCLPDIPHDPHRPLVLEDVWDDPRLHGRRIR
jgi:hypothetical protein